MNYFFRPNIYCFVGKQNCIYSDDLDTNSNMTIVLSPYYYWHLLEQFPISSISKARKIGEGILNSKISEQKQYSKFVIKSKKKKYFHLIALDMERLESAISKFYINKDRINKICFSTIELPNGKFDCGDTILFVSNNKYLEAQKALLSEDFLSEKSLNDEDSISNIIRSFSKPYFIAPYVNKKVPDNVFFEIIDNNCNKILILLFLILLLFSIKTFDQYNKVSTLKRKNDDIVKSQDFAKHTTQLSFMRKSLLKRHDEYNNFKKDIMKLNSIKTNKDTFLENITFKKSIGLDIEVVSQSHKDADKAIQKSGFIFVTENNGKFLYKLKK